MKKKSYEINMCEGPLLGKMLLFAFPLMLSSILQLLFNAADVVVVGRFAGSEALAAVGSTSALINLLINLFNGLSIGTNVLVARYLGARDWENTTQTVHTAVTVSLVSGVFLIFIGVFLSGPLLRMMGTPEDVLDKASLYMKIYFVGMPVFMLYNFGAAILRSIGDTQRPLYFLMLSGVINVILNLFFVIVCGMGVAGVAIATVVSEAVSAVLVLLCLLRLDGMCRVELKKLHINTKKLLGMLRIGLPAGLQGCIFSISNVLIQSSINSFGSVAMAGNTAAANLEGFSYVSMNAIYQTSLSFISQNMGAKQYKRINQITMRSMGLVMMIGLAIGWLIFALGEPLLGIYSSSPEVIEYGMIRVKFIFTTHFLCGMMDVMVGCLRGLGYSIMPMIVSLTGACAFRIIWIFTVFAANRTLETLYLSYPISWLLTMSVHVICYIVVKKRLDHRTAVPMSQV
ncbi:MAG: MATE family efflux transporter [Lachnospiraceae bacterium]|jgi:putative MATE family efflux protein|nr:MATE family efflux transporter [Lachnospiraceae bacterium]